MARLSSVSALLLVSVAFGCGSDSSVTPPPPPPPSQAALMAIVSGDAQKGAFDAALPAPLIVSVTTPTGTPIPNAKVNWGVVTGDGRLSSSSSVTDQSGQASVIWTLGPWPNVNQVIKAWADIENSQSVLFSATAENPVKALSVWPDTNVIFTGMTRTLSLTVVRGSTSGDEPAQSWSTSDASVATVENGVVTAVGAGHATITASFEDHVSPAIEVFVLPAPTPALRFTTWSGSCGLTTDGLMYCWDTPFIGMAGPFDRCRQMTTHGNFPYRCSEIPRLVSADLHFKALTGDASSGCAVTTVEGALYCWGGNTHGEAGLGSTDDLTRGPTRVPTDGEFLQVSGGYSTRCARRIDEVILCWGSNWRGDAGSGSPDVSYSSGVLQPTPINTSVRFLKLGKGGNCGLATDSTAYCWGSFVGDSAAAGCNTACSLSPLQVKSEKLVDLETSSWYCGIGVSGRAYCWGYHGFDPYRYAEPQEIPNPGFRSFEPALYAVDASGAAFKVDDYAALWHFRPINPELQYKRYWGHCGIALDDKLYCGTQYSEHGRLIPGQ